jgi:hypothetical protein
MPEPGRACAERDASATTQYQDISGVREATVDIGVPVRVNPSQYGICQSVSPLINNSLVVSGRR